MRKAGPAHVVRYHEQTARAVSAAAIAEKNAEVAIFNEGLTRARVEALEKTVYGLINGGFRSRLRWLLTGRASIVVAMPKNGNSDKNGLDTTKSGITMGAD